MIATTIIYVKYFLQMSNPTSDRYRIKRREYNDGDYIRCFSCGKKIKKYGWKYDFEKPYYLHIRGDFTTESEIQTVCYHCYEKRGKSHHEGYENSDKYLGLRRD
jgi:hypothetical protein